MPVVEVVEHLFHQVEELEMGVLGVGVDGLGAGNVGRAEGVPVNIFLLYKTVFLVDNLPKRRHIARRCILLYIKRVGAANGTKSQEQGTKSREPGLLEPRAKTG